MSSPPNPPGRPARAHDHANAGAGNFCARAGSDLTLFDQIVDQ
jgi:hypothetical protein